MKYILVLIMALSLSACSNDDDKAKALYSVLESCDVGATLSITLTTSSWANSITSSCTWVKKEEKSELEK